MQQTVVSTPVHYGYEMISRLKQVIILGVDNRPQSVKVNNKETVDFEFNENNNYLSVNNINAKMNQRNEITWN